MSLRYRVSILTMSQLSEEGPKSCVERTSIMLTEASTCLPASTLNKFWSLVLKACLCQCKFFKTTVDKSKCITKHNIEVDLLN